MAYRKILAYLLENPKTIGPQVPLNFCHGVMEGQDIVLQFNKIGGDLKGCKIQQPLFFSYIQQSNH